MRVAKQVLGKGFVDTLNDCLVSLNVNSPEQDDCLVAFHVFGKCAQEFAPGVNRQQLRPFQRCALVNLLKGLGKLIRIFRGLEFNLFLAAGDVDNS